MVGVSVGLSAPYLICVQNEFERKTVELRHGGPSRSDWPELAETCAGSWIFLAVDGDELSIRTDACGTIGLLFNPRKRAAASYAYLLLASAYFEKLDAARINQNGLNNDGWMTGGLTAHHGVARLFPITS